MMEATAGLSGFGGTAAAWLLTYWVHSTVLLGSAWMLSRWVLRREAWREVMWRAALVGGVITTSVSAFALPAWDLRMDLPLPAVLRGAESQGEDGIAPSEELIRDRLVDAEGEDRPASGAADASVSPSGSPSSSLGSMPEAPRSTGQPRMSEQSRSPIDGLTGARAPRAPVPGGSERIQVAASRPATSKLLLVWAFAAALLLGVLIRRHFRLHGMLEGRRTLSEGPLPKLLAGLRRSTGFWRPVRLSATTSIATPLALGRSEICVPERFLHALGEEEQKAALAHELGHLVRRDPAWNLLAQVLEAVFFFQPLHRVARARLRESAEFLADAWAVRETGSRLGLARCLAEVADWVSAPSMPDLSGSLAMAEGGSPLMARVRRLLESEPEAATPSAAGRAAALALVALTAAFAPAISSAASPNEPDPAEPVRAEERQQAAQTVEVVRVPATAALRERMRQAGAMARGRGRERIGWRTWSRGTPGSERKSPRTPDPTAAGPKTDPP
jgi:beta-lactamase regulating signal transducer with metallopeptidase domain